MDTPAVLQQQLKNEFSIPPEILESVTEILSDDEASLSACSLVSRSFLSACRVHRFRHLTFSNPSPADRLHAYERCLALRSLLIRAPDLIKYTFSLTLALEKPLNNDRNLLWIIERLDCLSSLELVSGVVEPIIDWDFLPEELQQALIALLRRSSNTLCNLTIDCYENAPLEILRGLVHSNGYYSGIPVGLPNHPLVWISHRRL
ncbi:hypothetical protein BDN72DRAFT_901029 [Pluteus cervinus]|uniref:Uncharacterized protein n=1 Tax=Pluteus cervinus TaxID=181527 RepID=A0ACD3AHN2_9AGAR|nr:hypothetical protein BDN72DRAFT_901029 [Pluteus cervinus]